MDVTLYRPVGQKELDLIAASDHKKFPPRLPEQPTFYPVCNEEYATQITRKWNTEKGQVGYVTRFKVKREFLESYDIHIVGSSKIHREYWIPAEDLDDFNDAIIGKIEMIGKYQDDSI
jgi:hypothetical protein